jgi:glycosyltransferase involved in cell wall biosynthesis
MNCRVICFLLPDLRGGGAERISLDLAHQFRRFGHAPEFLLMEARGELLDEARAVFPVHELSCARARQVPVALANHLRRHRPDALISAMWPLTAIAPLAQRLSGHRCSVIVSEHGLISAQYRDWGRVHQALLFATTAVGYRLATAPVGVSRGVAHDMAMLSRLHPSEVSVINNPVPQRPVPSLALLAHAESLWSVSRGARILTVASMKPVKNHSLLFRAFSRLSHPEAQLMIVGQGVGEHQLRKLAAELGITSRVVFAGFHSDPTPFYVTADLFVLSSDYEGFGNVIVEALAQGLPVVSTDCPSGPAEILENGRWGRLVPVGDAAALACAIEAELELAHDQDALKRRAADFAPDSAAKKYLNLMFPT